MLFPAHLWPGLAEGAVTVAFRRWRRPSVKVGGTLKSPGGLLSIDEVAVVDLVDITDEDARSAGCEDRRGVIASLRSEGTLYRVRFRRVGEDPRVALRARATIGEKELGDLGTALGRLPWALPTLRLIDARPGVVSTELAATMGMERPAFKVRVRRLKERGLTESLEVGYRLSPRGTAVLAALDSSPIS